MKNSIQTLFYLADYLGLSPLFLKYEIRGGSDVEHQYMLLAFYGKSTTTSAVDLGLDFEGCYIYLRDNDHHILPLC
jgi:hypothetical protein